MTSFLVFLSFLYLCSFRCGTYIKGDEERVGWNGGVEDDERVMHGGLGEIWSRGDGERGRRRHE